ncbi:acyltransferase family protein [Salinactinospora qingdaonensis]|uniref:Acyltransferase family protein n=1 Tax=Salinactinospora qingdaonensis TaxID=702744 RepID=A0ABP7GD98_9ACTN
MTAQYAHAPTPPVSPSHHDRRFLSEVQGLRAVAVLLVVVYHLNEEAVPGGYIGVDVFFVISGFLITTMLLREARRDGRISLANFYVRRIRRILPAATVVLLATGIGAFFLLPSTRLESTAVELAAAAGYVENLFLAEQAVDYLAAENAASPVQHFWSLAVEEQFYLLWPLLFVGWAASGGRLRRHRTLLGATLLIIAASFACSLWLTSSDPGRAYFLPQTRMWELATGGALAVALTGWNVPQRLRPALAWAGLAAIAVPAWIYSGATAFPGHAAALPVLGATAVIAAGHHGGRWSAHALLSSPPARFLGDISYALYLWHWPIIVFTRSFQDEALGPVDVTAALALSILLAWATKVTVEDPVRVSGMLRSLRPALVFAAAGALLVSALSVGQYTHVQRMRDISYDPQVHVGPQALTGGDAAPLEVTGPIYPPPVEADDDLSSVYADGCQAYSNVEQLQHCTYGPDDATTSIAIVGDSHAAAWVPAVREIAERNGWRLYTFTKSSCAFTATPIEDPDTDKPYTECHVWNADLIEELTTELRPSLVFTSSSVSATAVGANSDSDNTDRIAEGMAHMWHRIDQAGGTVVAIRDNPHVRPRTPECVELHGGNSSQCTNARSDAFDTPDPQVRAAQETQAQVELVDLTDRFCTSTQCPPVIGNILVYRDSHHVTATYARLLSDDLLDRIPRPS